MMARIPRLLLFDIDGTLTKSSHPVGSGGHSLLQALAIAFDRNIERNGVVFSDSIITRDVLSANGITKENCPNYNANVCKAIELMPGLVQTGITNGSYQWKSLPNVNELLETLSKRNDVRIALLTGNIQATALLKLKSAEIDTSLFMLENSQDLFGGFGSDPHEYRSDLVTVARKRYAEFLGHDGITPNDMVVIGDSPRDIECAHANNVPCVAVTTGIFDREKLTSADCILEGFKDISESVSAIIKTNRKLDE